MFLAGALWNILGRRFIGDALAILVGMFLNFARAKTETAYANQW
jgi:hypothetical protein